MVGPQSRPHERTLMDDDSLAVEKGDAMLPSQSLSDSQIVMQDAIPVFVIAHDEDDRLGPGHLSEEPKCAKTIALPDIACGNEYVEDRWLGLKGFWVWHSFEMEVGQYPKFRQIQHPSVGRPARSGERLHFRFYIRKRFK